MYDQFEICLGIKKVQFNFNVSKEMFVIVSIARQLREWKREIFHEISILFLEARKEKILCKFYRKIFEHLN